MRNERVARAGTCRAGLFGQVSVALLCSLGVSVASAAPIAWADWTEFTGGFREDTGSAAGTVTAGAVVIDVGYTGEVYGLETQVDGSGTDYWAPESSWADGSVVANAPPGTDIIAARGNTGATNTISFSEPVTNPVLAVFSLGRDDDNATVRYEFDSPFDVVVGGASMEFGGGAPVEQAGNVLFGREGNGTIQFLGTFSSIVFTIPDNESWHGWTVGVVVPLPAAGWLFLSAVGLLGWARRGRSAD